MLLCLFAAPSSAQQRVPNASDETVIATIPAGTQPRAIGINAKTDLLYVVDEGRPMSVIDAHPNLIVASIAVGSIPVAVGVNREQIAYTLQACLTASFPLLRVTLMPLPRSLLLSAGRMPLLSIHAEIWFTS